MISKADVLLNYSQQEYNEFRDCDLQADHGKVVSTNESINKIRSQTVSYQGAGDGGDFKINANSSSKINQSDTSICTSPKLADETLQSFHYIKTSSSPSTTAPGLIHKNKTNLIINYLPPSMSQEDVRLLFSGMGEVESCKLVREKLTGESLGYAFVKFVKADDAEKAILNINGLQLLNKTVKVSLARPSSETIKGANLYICGLPKNITATELESLFHSCGNIIMTRILCDQKTLVSRGIAFIRFDQRSEAEKAIKEFNNYVLPQTGEPITVKFANSPGSMADNRTGIVSKGSFNNSANNRTRYSMNSKCTRNSSINTFFSENEPFPIHSKKQSNSFNNTNIQSLKNCSDGLITSFPFGIRNPQSLDYLRNIFNGCDSTQIGQRVFQHPLLHGKSAYLGKCHNYGHFERPVALTKFKNHHRNSQSTHSLTYSQGGLNNIFDREDISSTAKLLLAPAFAASSGALTTNGWCIFVYNLGTDIAESILWQLFGPFGAVHSAKTIVDPATGKCKGYGFVTMSNYEEAVKAINALSGFNLDNRILQVSFKTTKPAAYLYNYKNSTNTNSMGL